MAQEFCFYGPSGCGKTVLTVKAAQLLAREHTVIAVFCDRVCPVLPWLFPGYGSGEIKSVGAALSAVEITENSVMCAATAGKNPNILYLGYGSGENLYSYPTFGSGRASALYQILDGLADYVLTDCSADFTADPLTETALKRSNVFRVYTPALSSFAFFDAQLPLLSGSEYRAEKHVPVLNKKETQPCPPAAEAAAALGRGMIPVPYSKTLSAQVAEGTLPDGPLDAKLASALRKMLQTNEKN